MPLCLPSIGVNALSWQRAEELVRHLGQRGNIGKNRTHCRLRLCNRAFIELEA
jgi:hypothetical protein